MTMQSRATAGLEVGLLWLVLVVGMVLHFNYGVSGLRYGVPFESPTADGTVPWANFGIKTIFYVMPLMLAVGTTGSASSTYRHVNRALAVVFAVANTAHLVGTMSSAADPLGYAQVVLLAGVLLANVQLIRLSSRWLRVDDPASSTSESAAVSDGSQRP